MNLFHGIFQAKSWVNTAILHIEPTNNPFNYMILGGWVFPSILNVRLHLKHENILENSLWIRPPTKT